MFCASKNVYTASRIETSILQRAILKHMAFNHYAKLKRILDDEPVGWYIRRVDEPTTAQTFRGELRHFDHYYRLCHADGTHIKYGKFQQLDRLATAIHTDITNLPVIDE
jgi:hypothetical protein